MELLVRIVSGVLLDDLDFGFEDLDVRLDSVGLVWPRSEHHASRAVIQFQKTVDKSGNVCLGGLCRGAQPAAPRKSYRTPVGDLPATSCVASG